MINFIKAFWFPILWYPFAIWSLKTGTSEFWHDALLFMMGVVTAAVLYQLSLFIVRKEWNSDH